MYMRPGLTGHLNIFFFYRLWNKLPKIENIPNIMIDNAVLSPNVIFVRWKVHLDWVTQVKFYLSMCIYTFFTKKCIYVLLSIFMLKKLCNNLFSGVAFYLCYEQIFLKQTEQLTLLSIFRQNIFKVFKLLSLHQMKNLRLLSQVLYI